MQDVRAIFVSLEGLIKVLASGKEKNPSDNPYAYLVEQYGLLESLEEL